VFVPLFPLNDQLCALDISAVVESNAIIIRDKVLLFILKKLYQVQKIVFNFCVYK
jgi:hypothetical protein